mgnify:CR=1 FL=1
MKIDPVTYEVDVSAGTHPLYVWEAPVRIWHWAMAVCMAVMIVTGFLIGAPLVANLGDTWATYDFAYIRLAHFAAGMIFTVIFIWRLYWGIVGNKYSRMILVPPLWSLKWWKMLFEQVKYYLFLKKDHPLGAKLGVPQKKFIGYLLEKGYVFRDRHRSDRVFVRAGKRNDPLFVTRDFYLPNGTKSEYTLVTPAGKAHFLKIAEKIRVWEPREAAEGKDASEQAVFAACV